MRHSYSCFTSLVLAFTLTAPGCVIVSSTKAGQGTSPSGADPAAKPDEPKAAKPDKKKDKKKEEKKVAKKEEPKAKEPKEKKSDKPDEPKDKPVANQPADKPAADPAPEAPAPQPEQSKIVVPVKVALKTLTEQVEALIPPKDSRDWTQVTQGNKSPKADLKYELWRDPIAIKVKDGAFIITVPVRYAATIRAQIKNPLTRKWVWIAKSETWGTRDEPQHITGTFEAKLAVDADWRIKSDLRLIKLGHGEPPSGKICKNVGIEVCMPKSSIASEVREGIDKRLEKEIKNALGKLDGKVEKAFDLRKRAQAVWGAMQSPQALPRTNDGAWLVVKPQAIGVGEPEKDGDDVRVDLSIEGRLTVEAGAKPKVKATSLPKLSNVKGEPGFHVIAELKLPTDALSETLLQELKGTRLEGKKEKLSLASAQVVADADPKHPRRVTLKVSFGDSQSETLELQGELTYDAKSQVLSISDLDFAVSSKGLLADELSGFDHKTLRKQLQKKARWDLSREALPLKKAITAALHESLRGHVAVDGALREVDVRDFSLTEGALTANVIIGGNLELEIR